MKKLQDILHRIDGKGYKAYKEIRGLYNGDQYSLAIDYVQGDPFASPSKIRIITPRKNTTINKTFTNSKLRKVYIEDYINRAVSQRVRAENHKVKGSGKSGLIAIDTPGQEVLERTAVKITDHEITICLSIGLPAAGRKVLGKQAIALLLNILPLIMDRSLFAIQDDALKPVIQLCDQQEAIRDYMKRNNIISFVANDSILPRESGISNLPLRKGTVIPFQSPGGMFVEIPIPYKEEPIKGMAIYKGITLIVGGGYHGKSTLLQAIERGVYNHIKGDGREYVLTDPSAMKIRAEDGRGITNVNISPFIKNLPYGKDTKEFSSDNGSGSTSQAANIVESLEAGSTVLLIDEDTSATNFMIRDSRMQVLVAKDKEPITPFVDKVKQLYDDHGVSTILVMGGSGDYFDIADCVVMLDQYIPHEVTKKAKEIAQSFSYRRAHEGGEHFGDIQLRIPLAKSFASKEESKPKIKVRGKNQIQYGKTDILLNFVEQLIDESQTRSIAEIFQYLNREKVLEKQYSFNKILTLIENRIDEKGLESFVRNPNEHPGELARPRVQEIAAALNRLRTLKVK